MSIFAKAARELQGPENYSRSSPDSVLDDHKFDAGVVCLSLSQWLERANCQRGNTGLKHGPDAPLAEAKAKLCLKLRTIHLDAWERDQRPKWDEVRRLFEETI